MNFRYTIYNRVTGLHTENECEAVNEKMFVITLLETMGPEDWQNTKVSLPGISGYCHVRIMICLLTCKLYLPT